MIESVYDLKVRIFNQLGDDPTIERYYEWSKILPLIRDGIAYQRAAAGDVWDWDFVPVTQNVGEYTFPSNALKLRRVAWRDHTLDERSRMYLEAIDWNWEARAGEPTEYTIDGFSSNVFRLYPKPQATTGDNVAFRVDPQLLGATLPSANYGKITRMDGVTPFQVDPNLNPPGLLADPDYGIIVAGFNFTGSPKGKIVKFSPDFSEAVTVWFIEKAPTVVDDFDPVPFMGAHRIGPMCYALWKIYDEEGEHHNGILSAYFRDWFFSIVERAAKHAANPLPRIVHVMRPVGPGESMRRRGRWSKRFPDSMTDPNGNTWELLW